MLPEVGVSRQARQAASVDFPEPDPPIIAMRSPCEMLKLISFNARTPVPVPPILRGGNSLTKFTVERSSSMFYSQLPCSGLNLKQRTSAYSFKAVTPGMRSRQTRKLSWQRGSNAQPFTETVKSGGSPG